MTRSTRTRLLAIAIDAAEPTFVRRLINEGEMPALGSLLREGTWLRVKSPAYVGSGAVWPTFMSAQSPQNHGVYGEWLWDAGTMSLSRYHGNDLEPFWKELVGGGISVGILDVPFMPLIGLANGFEISEWGPHDILEARTQIAPENIAAIVEENSPHPLQKRIQLTGPDDYRNLELLGDACLQGIKRRGETARALLAATGVDFGLIAFTEIHRCAHYLWHQVEPSHPVYARNAVGTFSETRPTLIEIFRELDRQIGALIEEVGAEARVIIFSLHGMQPAHGTPAFLPSLLCEMGLARLADWNSQTWRDRTMTWFGRLKRSLPAPLKTIYYKLMPPNITFQLAQPTMLPAYDWSRTKAFSLPTDQHGWIRVNLEGREASGIVAPAQYEILCNELEQAFRQLSSIDGQPLVRDVIRTSKTVDAAMSQRLPDIVIHWGDAVFAPNLHIAGSSLTPQFAGMKYMGQHGLEGFCIVSEHDAWREDHVRAEDMHLLIKQLLNGSH
ncbi:MAG: alkaline phosphatase family protein [Pyrinomonadaceae bacterium]